MIALRRVYTWLLAMACVFAMAVGTAGAAEYEGKILNIPVKEVSVEYIADIVYSQPSIYGYPNYKLTMDLLIPDSDERLPAIVYVPGGGFMSANNDKTLQQRLDLAEAGYVVASIEYRVTPQSTFPAPLEDVKAAIRFLRANADSYGIDTDAIAVMGHSAGGYLAALAGTTNGIAEFDKGAFLEQSSEVQAVVDIYGLSDLTDVGSGFSEEVQEMHKSPSAPEAMWVNGPAVFGPGGSIHDDPKKAEKANPIHYITKDAPPFLIMHGDSDSLVSPNQTKILHQALVEHGVESSYYVVKGAGHGGPQWHQEPVTKLIVDFLDAHVK